MRGIYVIICAVMLATPSVAQESGSGGADLTRELWAIDDANVVETGRLELRFTGGWVTSHAPANLGDSDDDFVFTPSLVWGTCNNVEVFADVPIWLGDSGDRGALENGNADTYVGFTWRIADAADWMPAHALRTTLRIPTGDDSNKVDAEFRMLLTNDYDSGIRSHVNAWITTANGLDVDDDDFDLDLGDLTLGLLGDGGELDRRHLQWGVALGLDGPLCADGAVRWVMDYMNRSSEYYGRNNTQIFEAGWEWTIDDTQKMGMSVQVGLDRVGDTPNFGAGINYSRALTF